MSDTVSSLYAPSGSCWSGSHRTDACSLKPLAPQCKHCLLLRKLLPALRRLPMQHAAGLVDFMRTTNKTNCHPHCAVHCIQYQVTCCCVMQIAPSTWVSAHPHLSKALSALPHLLVSRVEHHIKLGQRCALCYRSRGEGGLRQLTFSGECEA
jgi:hypothetical protein